MPYTYSFAIHSWCAIVMSESHPVTARPFEDLEQSSSLVEASTNRGLRAIDARYVAFDFGVWEPAACSYPYTVDAWKG